MAKYRIKSPNLKIVNRVKYFGQYLLKHRKVTVLLSVLIILSYLLFLQLFGNSKNVTTTLVTRDNFSTTFTANGEIKARKMADLKFYSPGRVSNIYVKNGDSVKAYQKVASLDQVALYAAYKQSINNVRQQEASTASTYDVLQGKDKTETFNEKDVRTKAEVAKDNAYEQVKIAADALKNAVVVSPISGTVSDTNDIISGMNISGSDLETKFIRVVDLNTLYFAAEVDTVDFGKVKDKQKAVIKLDAYPERNCDGEIVYINKVGKKTVGGVVTFPVEVKLINCNLDLGVSLSGQADFVIENKENVLSVPKKYLIIKEGDNYIWKKTGTTPKQRTLVPVKLGESNQNNVEILDGLTEGDTIVFVP